MGGGVGWLPGTGGTLQRDRLQVLPYQPDGDHHADDQIHGQAEGIPPGVLVPRDLDDLVGGLEPLLHHRRLRGHKGVLLPLGIRCTVGGAAPLLVFYQQIDGLVGIRGGQLQGSLQLHILPEVVLAEGQPLLSDFGANQAAVEEEDLGTILFAGRKVKGIELGRATEVAQLQKVQLQVEK